MITVGATLFGALTLNSVAENVSFRKAFFDLDAIRSLKAQLDSVANPGQQILADHVFDAAYRYYFNRNTVALILNPPYRFPTALDYYSIRNDRVSHRRAARSSSSTSVSPKRCTTRAITTSWAARTCGARGEIRNAITRSSTRSSRAGTRIS